MPRLTWNLFIDYDKLPDVGRNLAPDSASLHKATKITFVALMKGGTT